MLTIGLARRRPIREDRRREVGRSKARRAIEQAEIDRIRRVLHQRPKPPWRLLWRGRPLHLPAGARRMGPWARRRLELQAGWQLLWDERLRRNLAPIYQLVACRRGRHRDAQVMADDLIGQ
jgi:hypothetical protein